MLPTLWGAGNTTKDAHEFCSRECTFSLHIRAFLAALWHSTWWLWVRLGRGRRRALPDGSSVAVGSSSPSLPSSSPWGAFPWAIGDGDGTIPSMGESPRCWEGTTGLCALPGQRLRTTSANAGCPLGASFFHPCSHAGCRQTQSWNLDLFFSPFTPAKYSLSFLEDLFSALKIQ